MYVCELFHLLCKEKDELIFSQIYFYFGQDLGTVPT
jgi:hypothetical protein